MTLLHMLFPGTASLSCVQLNDALMIGGPKRCQVVRKRAEVGQVQREMNVRCEVKHEGHKHRILGPRHSW